MTNASRLFSPVLLAATLIFGITPALAQTKSSGPTPSNGGGRIPVTRQDDPLTRDPMRPNEYERQIAMKGSHSELEAMLKSGNDARAATPPRLADAERDYLRAAEIDPKEARAYVGLGNVYAAQNKVKETIESFKKAIELKPKLAEAHFNLGLVYAATGKTEAALEQYELLKPLSKDLAKKLKDAIPN